MSEWVNVTETSDFLPGQRKFVEIDGYPVAVFNLEGEFHAFIDCCPHAYLPLGDGCVNEDKITCPFHGAVFCIKTGEVLAAPANANLTLCEVRVNDEQVQVKLP